MRAGGETVPREALLERTMVRVRWAGVVFGALQLGLYSPPEGVQQPTFVGPAGYGLLACLAVVNLITMMVLRRPGDGARLRRLGAMNFLADLAAIWGLVWLFNFEPAGTTWVIITFGCLEGALRHGLLGAMAPVGAAVVLETIRDLFRQSVYGFPFHIDAVTFRVGVMAIIAFVAGMMARNLRRERERAEHRARLLSAVATAGRAMSTLDHETVMGAVVAAATELGFDASELCVFDPEGQTFHVRHARGLPEGYLARPKPVEGSLAGMVRERRETLFVEDYATFEPGVTMLREAGFRAVIATPVWSGGDIVAALIAGTKDQRPISSEEREAIELLAAHAGRAHENARRFEDERRAVERLAELDRLKREFLSMVSHELRTPLTAIEGMGLTLERSWEALDDDTRRQLLSRVNANSRTLDGIIASMLDFSRVDSGALRISVEPFDLSELARGVASRLDELLSGHDLRVEVEDGMVVSGDRLLIDRVLENLFSNASKHTPPGTQVRLHASAEGEHARVTVTDTGPGISPQDLPYLGQRFFRGGDPNHRDSKGIGLGLALAREILILHGTDLEIGGEPGRGARFGFRLPLVRPGSPGDPAAPRSDAGSP